MSASTRTEMSVLATNSLTGDQRAALGVIPGAGAFTRSGHNTDVDAAEDLWDGGGDYTGLPSGTTSAVAETVDVSSSSAADAAAGTGMRSIRLSGLDQDGTLVTEDVTLNGLTAVTTTGRFYRVLGARGLTGGSGGTNAGTVTVKHHTTTANVFTVIAAGDAEMAVCAGTVPAGYHGLISRITFSLSNNVAAQAVVGLMVREYGSGIWCVRHTLIGTTAAPITDQPAGGFYVDALTDVKLRVLSTTVANLEVAGRFDILYTAKQAL